MLPATASPVRIALPAAILIATICLLFRGQETSSTESFLTESFPSLGDILLGACRTSFERV